MNPLHDATSILGALTELGGISSRARRRGLQYDQHERFTLPEGIITNAGGQVLLVLLLLLLLLSQQLQEGPVDCLLATGAALDWRSELYGALASAT